jgi:hypothetical protein
MDDLSHWDFAELFTGEEAAAVILGLEPKLAPQHKIEPVLRRMEFSYNLTLKCHLDELHLSQIQGGDNKGHFDFVFPIEDRRIYADMESLARKELNDPECLHSGRMIAFYNRIDHLYESKMGPLEVGLFELDEDRFNRWLAAGKYTSFEVQLFSRKELARWLDAIGQTSKYQFLRSGETVTTYNSARFSGGQRRDILTPILETAASQCRNGKDVAELWVKLQSLARSRTAPLIGVTEAGIQYLDVNDSPKEFTLKALRARLRRAR